jgi:hypothetical protein
MEPAAPIRHASEKACRGFAKAIKEELGTGLARVEGE